MKQDVMKEHMICEKVDFWASVEGQEGVSVDDYEEVEAEAGDLR